jgi:lytic murein transglycosylase
MRLAWAAMALALAGPARVQPVSTDAVAEAAPDPAFAAYLESLRPRALAAGIRAETMDALFPTLVPSERVVALDRAQPAPRPDAPIPPFAPYAARHIDARKISRGRAVYAANRALLTRTEQETGVPESLMVAIYGHETDYGRFTGNFDLLRALATLAYEGRRRDLFEPEFLAALKLLDSGVPRARLVGSYAGATGYPQFLPSVYLRVARDADGDGHADIWSSEPDALASIANYFRDAGWRPGQGWGIRVTVPAGFDRAAIANRTHPPRCQRVFDRHSRWLTMAEWRARGIAPAAGAAWMADDVLATLIEPDGQGAPGYLLTGNYRAILDYNCSNFYALSVGLLADAVAN